MCWENPFLVTLCWLQRSEVQILSPVPLILAAQCFVHSWVLTRETVRENKYRPRVSWWMCKLTLLKERSDNLVAVNQMLWFRKQIPCPFHQLCSVPDFQKFEKFHLISDISQRLKNWRNSAMKSTKRRKEMHSWVDVSRSWKQNFRTKSWWVPWTQK